MPGLLLLILLSGFSISTVAEIYKWENTQGQVYYSDKFPPPPAKAEQKKVTANVIETDAEPYETKMAAQKNPVTLYVFSGCGEGCDRAKVLLDKRGIPYSLKNTDADHEYLKKITGNTRMPVLIVGKQTPRQGFEEETWNSMLNRAGYPKNNPLAGLRKKSAKAPPQAKPDTPANKK